MNLKRASEAAVAVVLATVGWQVNHRHLSDSPLAERQPDCANSAACHVPGTRFSTASGMYADAETSETGSNHWQAELALSLSLDIAGDRRSEIADSVGQVPDEEIPAAAAWIESLPISRSARGLALNLILSRWVIFGPTGAVDFIDQLPDTAERSQLLSSAALNWGTRQPGDAIAWAANLPYETRREVSAAVAMGIAQTSPAMAATWVAEMEPGPDQQAAALDVVAQWANTDPESAANWAVSFPAGAMRENALRDALAVWRSRDADATHAWLLTLPNGEFKDSIVATMEP